MAIRRFYDTLQLGSTPTQAKKLTQEVVADHGFAEAGDRGYFAEGVAVGDRGEN